MSRFLLALIVGVVIAVTSPLEAGAVGGHGACYSGQFGGVIDCGGGYAIQGSLTTSPTQPTSDNFGVSRQAVFHQHSGQVIPLAPYVANGPTGPCIALGPANPTPNLTVLNWQAGLHLPNCATATPAGARTPAPPPINPATLAIQFWTTIPLPRPHPSVPPGWALCGKPAYLVTGGTVGPVTWQRPTPLGTLTITATGAYDVNWGDPVNPGWSGPYPFEGQAWPSGLITHVYDDAGTVRITVEESWNAVWHLGPLTGHLDALHTATSIPAYPVRQLQTIITN